MREGWLNEQGEGEARALPDLLAEDWREVQPTDEVRSPAALDEGFGVLPGTLEPL
ncbi:MAG TPA: hypothetical protein VJ827_10510 [Rubrobacter sp.]|nr:hypothetical protein [Rubrobacter sp.]